MSENIDSDALLTAITLLLSQTLKHSPNRALIIQGAQLLIPDTAEALLFSHAPDDFRERLEHAMKFLVRAIDES